MAEKKKKSIFENSFSRTFEIIRPEEGVEAVRIETTSVANIPGVIRHWREEIEKRKKDILEYESRNFFERFFDWITDDEDTDDPSGDEIYNIAPTKEAKDLMENIEDDPTDMNNRLELVAYILKNGQIITIEAARDLFLQGTVACCFGELSGQGLLTSLNAQELYFRLLLKRCNYDLAKIKKILDSHEKDDLFARQKNKLFDFQDRIRQNTKLIESYLKYTAKGIETIGGQKHLEISIEELQKTVKSASKIKQNQRKELYDKASVLLAAMRFQPLLHDEVMNYLSPLIQMDKNHPLPLILKARIYRLKLLFLMKQKQVGIPDKELVILIKDRFLRAHDAYQDVINAKKLALDGKLLKLAYLEFSRLIIDCRSYFRNRLNRELPERFDIVYLEKVKKLVGYLGKSKETREILDELILWEESP